MRSASILAALLLLAPARSRAMPLYEEDGRLDLYQVEDALQSRLARSAVALFSQTSVRLDPGGSVVLDTRMWTRMEDKPLCPAERFYGQPKGAFCSGALVGPDLVMTAQHCVTSEEECRGTSFVFGFAMSADAFEAAPISREDVYGCDRIVASGKGGFGGDWALVRLDRAVTGREPLRTDLDFRATPGDEVFVIGHPKGLPVKVTLGGRVRAAFEGYFVTDLDTYSGNSGSPVFHAGTGRVIGILFYGEDDFIDNGQCRSSRVCGPGECSGESVTSLAPLAEHLGEAFPSAFKAEKAAAVSFRASGLRIEPIDPPDVFLR